MFFAQTYFFSDWSYEMTYVCHPNSYARAIKTHNRSLADQTDLL